MQRSREKILRFGKLLRRLRDQWDAGKSYGDSGQENPLHVTYPSFKRHNQSLCTRVPPPARTGRQVWMFRHKQRDASEERSKRSHRRKRKAQIRSGRNRERRGMPEEEAAPYAVTVDRSCAQLRGTRRQEGYVESPDPSAGLSSPARREVQRNAMRRCSKLVGKSLVRNEGSPSLPPISTSS